MTAIPLQPEKVEAIVLTCCLLHNYLRTFPSACAQYTPPDSLDSEHAITHEVYPGRWRTENSSPYFKDLVKQGSNNSAESSKLYRSYFMEYFNSEAGAVPWQENMI